MAQLFQDEMAALGIADTGAAMTTPGAGIGMAPAAQPQKRSGFDMFMEGVGGAAAGALGKPLPHQVRAEAERKKRTLELQELQSFTNALEEGVKLTDGLEGPERDTFVKSYKERLNALEGGLGDTYEAATKRPEMLTKFREVLPHLPEHLRKMAEANPKGFLKFAGTAEGVKVMTQADDQRILSGATKKVQTTMMGLQQLIKPEKLAEFNKDGVLTASEIREMQADLPEPLRLSEPEMQAIGRNDESFWTSMGVLSGKGEQDLMKKRAGKVGEAPKTRTVRRGDKEITQSFKDGKWVDEESGQAFKPSEGDTVSESDIVGREFKLSDDYRADTKKFAERRPLFDSATDYMANRPESKTSSGDAALMFAYAKMRDPNDRLAVSETRDLVKLGNIFERFGVSVTGVLEKGETLPDRVAKDMYAEIRRAFTEQNRQQAKIEADYRRKTTDYKGNPDRVVRPLAIPEEQLNPKGGGGEPSQADLEFTAKKHGITVEEVKRRLKAGKK
jgi:hypothetical protein